MVIKNLDDLNSVDIDALREIGSIGTGNAATSLSGVLDKKIEITMPEVRIMEYNEAIATMGGPEKIVSGVLKKLSGEINGIVLFIQTLDFINVVLESVLKRKVNDYQELEELEISALTEIGNIVISSYITPIATMTDTKIDLSTPYISINMLGAILSEPMVAYGYQTDKLMTINGNFIYNNKEVYSNLILAPDISSLNYILKQLGVSFE